MELEKGRRNIVKLLEKASEKYANFNYASRKTDEGWQSYTYSEVFDSSSAIALYLSRRGFKKGQKAAILSEGSPMWIMAEYSLLINGIISVPLSVKLLPEELPFRLDHSESELIFVSKNHLEKVLSILHKLQNQDLKLVYLDEDTEFFTNKLKEYNVDEERGLVIWKMMEEGKNIKEDSPDLINSLILKIEEDDVVNISYTSGTTGNPKGIMLTHLNYYSNAHDGINMFRLKEGFRTLVILPVDHSFAHTVALYGALFKALDLYFLDARGGVANALKNIPINLSEVKPEFLLTVPALTANFMNKMKEGVQSKGKLVSSIFKYGLEAAISRQENPSFINKLKKYLPYKLASLLILGKLKEVFGGKLQYMVGGGALLDIKQQQFFMAIGAPVYQGYGLTEAAPIISANTPYDFKLGTSGKILNGIQCKIINDEGKEVQKGEIGEIVIQGDNVMPGYYKNSAESKVSLKDKWLYTGDLGYFDNYGFLVVTGRNKALLISEDGEKYSPESIEEAIVNTSEFISQAMIYNDHRKYTTAVVTIDSVKLNKLKQRNSQEIMDLVKKDLHTFKKDPIYANRFPSKWTPSYFVISPQQFSEENKMVNSTMKMVRHKIVEYHKNDIEKMYAPNAAATIEELNLKSLQSMMN